MSLKPRFIDVFIPRRAGRLWTYRLPDQPNAVAAGTLTVVPFGRSHLLALTASAPYISSDIEPDRVRNIAYLDDFPLLPDDVQQLLTWLSRYYLVDLGRVLDKLITLSLWRPVKTDGHWTIETTVKRLPKNVTLLTDAQHVSLTPDQQDIYSKIRKFPGAHLLEGVTGSGKTEVYMALARDCIARKKSVLVLVPEIALASLTAEKFARRLGVPVGLWHSAIADGKRIAITNALREKSLPVLVGARSALFAPIQDLGLVIVDEEHDSGFQLSDGLHINIRDAAIQRARFANATIILGSATPSVTSAYAARGNTAGMSLHYLHARAQNAHLPDVRIIDIGLPVERGPYPWLSKSLYSAIETTLQEKQQVVLFRNRRGYHPAILCNACDQRLECPNCAMPLTLHARPVELKCHLCGYRETPPERCPNCNSTKLVPVGTGTQRIHEELIQLFPEARISRLDRDQTTSAGRIERILQDLQNGETDILVGTQMITKGLDVENVTLVGVINLDGALHQPDFRASERAFQHLCQVSGRAGRGRYAGQVMIQTHHTEHPVIAAALQQSYQQFYDHELAQRKMAGYPPFRRVVRIVWSSRNEHAAQRIARQACRVAQEEAPDVSVLGPTPPAIVRVQGRSRYHAIARSADVQELRLWATAARNASISPEVDCDVQFDPGNLM